MKLRSLTASSGGRRARYHFSTLNRFLVVTLGSISPALDGAARAAQGFPFPGQE